MILIDGNSIGFAASAGREMMAGTVPTGGTFGFINRIHGFRQQYNGKMIVLWDGKSWRFDDFPSYKSARTKNPKVVALKELWKKQRPYCGKLLHSMGVTQMLASNMEADDLAGRLCKSLEGRVEDITLITGDGDWLQCVRDGVRWVDPIRDRSAVTETLIDQTGYQTAWQFIQSKALKGDQGDSIPGVGGIGPKGADWIISTFGSVEGFINSYHLENIEIPAKIRKGVQGLLDDPEVLANYHRNLKLVWINHPDVPKTVGLKNIKATVDHEKFADLCAELAFHGHARTADMWLRPFETQETALV